MAINVAISQILAFYDIKTVYAARISYMFSVYRNVCVFIIENTVPSIRIADTNFYLKLGSF